MLSLQKLSFQEVNLTGANPICKMDNYISEMYKTFPKLQTLDGIKKEFEVIFIKIKTEISNERRFI